MCGLLADTGSPLPLPAFQQALAQLSHRGPDQTVVVTVQDPLPLAGDIKLGFVRLAIMDTSTAGQQPFVSASGQQYALCNGEIYNHRELRQQLSDQAFRSGSDCEVLLPLYERHGIEGLLRRLDGEFAFVIYDAAIGRFFAARDPIGIRPLFYGFESQSGRTLFASEAKALQPHCSEVYPFPPGHYYDGEKLLRWLDPAAPSTVVIDDEALALSGIRDRLTEAVHKRLDADVPLGFLLSGGLDSSLVCGIAARALSKPLVTFAVGLRDKPIDMPYARQVADYLGSDHHEVYFEMDEAISGLSELIRQLETWDVTTVRASIGMYLVCQYVKRKTAVRVLLTGEVSDEVFGYKYTDFAPSAIAFQREAQKRVRELYAYDVLRADRCIAAHGIEARVPFSDTAFVQWVMAIDPELKRNTRGMGKWLLRQAFAGTSLLPDSILWREKAAFSDAVGHGLVEQLKAYAERKYSDGEFCTRAKQFEHCPPQSKEALLYRELFESHYPDRATWIPDYWLPNKEWANCNVIDPSARVLPNYGMSGV